MAFLEEQGVVDFDQAEVQPIDQTLGLYDEQDQLVGTGSIAGQVIKYIAFSHAGEEHPGSRFNQIVSALESALAEKGCFYLFVFTKATYQEAFEHIGFQTLAKTAVGLILEKGTPNIEQYRASLPKKPVDAGQTAAIVMNANPFTKGHRYLIEQAAQENDWVMVFVVNQDVSLFKTTERMAMVQKGTEDIANVVVANGGDYMVSYLSFPAYFIDDRDQAIRFQTALDAELFKQQIAEPLGLSARYIGTEPTSHTTTLYNQQLKKILPPQVAVKEVPRLSQDGQAISARTVRQALKDQQLSSLADLLPETTLDFIKTNQEAIMERIAKGQQIHGN
ncbi:[citrate (pro-3S)-lyase] ligase [Fructobacillus sp. M158]|uniref:[citrate (pro-3S)-lyase] ligase n=1 Tax=Fructobacillus parabroussonetiae TaxID=2713174 RepID=UPI00200B39E9|nr:[citrate (pro-3S)-lyase] ligase [Fructobacillus parabroussonetiae]MCK8617194.1 [citrate (pro-3S)-lyase] ligase [Fructobacillus parabroussonetiae]